MSLESKAWKPNIIWDIERFLLLQVIDPIDLHAFLLAQETLQETQLLPFEKA